jgi:hypothetical protein
MALRRAVADAENFVTSACASWTPRTYESLIRTFSKYGRNLVTDQSCQITADTLNRRSARELSNAGTRHNRASIDSTRRLSPSTRGVPRKRVDQDDVRPVGVDHLLELWYRAGCPHHADSFNPAEGFAALPSRTLDRGARSQPARCD